MKKLPALEYSSLSGLQIISHEELIKNYPEAAKALFKCAKEQYQIAAETLDFLLEGVCDFEPHVADIIDARDPEFWKSKKN